ncbi:MAG TPA: flagellar brake protein [Burkholderiaceae bacterium]|nr:flagellar brake protein [Burkholderiaceae bacterium]
MPTPSDHDEDPFLITGELEIGAILRSIQRAAALLRMYPEGKPDHSIMTTILEYNADTRQLIVDCSSESEFNERLVKAPNVVFDTHMDQITIHFKAENPQSTTHDGLPAFVFSAPKSLRRVQRREFYRVEVPVGEPATCTLLILESGQQPRRVQVKLKDISGGGVALLDPDNQLPRQSGITFENARLTLPEVGEAVVDLEVLRVHTNVLPNKKEIVELACRFKNIPNPTLMLVQGYIGRLERRLNAKRRGY